MTERPRCPRCGLELQDLGSLGDWCPGCSTFIDPSAPGSTRTQDPPPPRLAPEPRSPSILAFTPGEIVAERYRVVSLVGRGGMGEVSRADDLRLGQPVALKFLSPALSRNEIRLQRFLREVRLARQTGSPVSCCDQGAAHVVWFGSIIVVSPGVVGLRQEGQPERRVWRCRRTNTAVKVVNTNSRKSKP
jgi:hypothetical protein